MLLARASLLPGPTYSERIAVPQTANPISESAATEAVRYDSAISGDP